jgi:hypothetical protein
LERIPAVTQKKVVKFPTYPRKSAVRYGAPALVVEEKS